MRFEVYLIATRRGRPVYVGQGLRGRAHDHLYPSRFKNIGLNRTPVVWKLQLVRTRKEAWDLEAKWIEQHHPPVNRARFKSTGGLHPWNLGIRGDSRCRGGRPRGIPMTAAQRHHLSRAMRGRSSAWMTGRSPWNKGLTKKNHPSLARIGKSMMGNFRGRRRRHTCLTAFG